MNILTQSMASSYDLYGHKEPNLTTKERKLFESVSRDRQWELLKRISNFRRISSSDGEKRAAEIIMETLDENGIQYENHNPQCYVSVPNDASIQVSGNTWSGSDDNFENENPEVKALAFSYSGTVSADAVYVDPNDSESGNKSYNRSAFDPSVDVDGKIVIMETTTTSKKFFRDVQRSGAAGLVMIHPNEEPFSTQCTWIWGGVPASEEAEETPEIPFISVSQEVGKQLLNYVDDNTTSTKIKIETNLTQGWAECPLVVAKIPAANNPNNDFVLLHGHIDSWFYGVTDNATGDVGMVECARILNQHKDDLKRDLWVAWWPAHENGRYGGSTWFADNFGVELAENCIAHVCMDSTGVADATEFVERGKKWMASAHNICKKTIDDVVGKPTTENRPSRSGDYSFSNIGVPGMTLSPIIPKEIRNKRGYLEVGGSGGNTDIWHQSTDTLENADPDLLERDTRLFLVLLYRLLSSEVVPVDHQRTLNRHRKIIEDYDDIAGDDFDLSEILTEIDKLGKTVNTFYESIESGNVEYEDANEAIKKLSRRLISMNFTSEGNFKQDPGINQPPYPILAPVKYMSNMEGDEYHYQLTSLKRSRNRVLFELREARREIESIL
jgi:hypothetical protein